MKFKTMVNAAIKEGAAAKSSAASMNGKELKAAIDLITETLKGTGISFNERLCLSEERKALRAVLIERKGK